MPKVQPWRFTLEKFVGDTYRAIETHDTNGKLVVDVVGP